MTRESFFSEIGPAHTSRGQNARDTVFREIYVERIAAGLVFSPVTHGLFVEIEAGRVARHMDAVHGITGKEEFHIFPRKPVYPDAVVQGVADADGTGAYLHTVDGA